MTPQPLGDKEKKISNSFGGRHKTWKPWREQNGRGPWRQKRELQQRKPICRWPELVTWGGKGGFLGAFRGYFSSWRKRVCGSNWILLVLRCLFFLFLCVDYVKIWISLFGIFTLLLWLCVSSMFHWTSHFWWFFGSRSCVSVHLEQRHWLRFFFAENGKNSARALQCFRRADLVLSFFFLHHFSIAWCP